MKVGLRMDLYDVLTAAEQVNDQGIDKSSPVPLYLQLRQILEKKISDGYFKSDENFLSELELCDLYEVSRTTVRQTLREMLNDEVLYRRDPRGRLLVTSPKVQQVPTRLQGFFTEDVLHSGLQPCTKVLSISEITRPALAASLGLKEGEPIFAISRIHEGDGEPLALQTSYIPKKILPNMHQLDLSNSIFSHIEQWYGHKIVSAKQHISVRLPDGREKGYLQIPPKVCIFQVNRITYADNGVAVEYFECMLRGDRYTFSMDLSGRRT